MFKRIIPRIDIKGPNLVKGICLEGLRVLGSPEYFSKLYYDGGADEIIYHDVVASLYDRKSILPLIKKTSKNCFIPLSISGGIRSLRDIENILKNGGDKIFLNSAAINNPELIDQSVKAFGSSTIGISIEVSTSPSGKKYVLYNYGREHSNRNISDWIKEVQERGIGELSITSVNHEGYGKGMNLRLLEEIYDILNVPLIYHGGVGSLSDTYNVLKYDKVNAISISSSFHYHEVSKKNYKYFESNEGNFSFLKEKREKTNFDIFTIIELKKFLKSKGISVRL
jgi:imidazole glycerol-phosphate synthase subunit HisF